MLKIIENQKSKLLSPIILLTCLLCLVAPAYFSYLVIENTVNAPFMDDYNSLIDFFNLFVDTDSMAEKLSLVLGQFGEHRLIFLRLVGASVFYTQGNLDFKLLCYIGNAVLALIAFFLFFAFKTNGKYKVLFFSPALFLLFQPQYQDTLLMPTQQLSDFCSFLFALVALVFIERKTRTSFIIACIFAVLTISSQGNGLLILPLGLTALCLQKSYKRAGIWLVISVLVIIFYFAGYRQLPGDPSVTEGLINIKGAILYALCFTGSAAGFSSFYLSLLCGICIVLYFIFLTVSKYFKDNPTLYFLFLFVLLSVSINALFRSWRGAEYALSQPRYKFIAISAVILLYLSLCEIVQRKRSCVYVAVPALLLAMMFFIVSSSLYSPRVVENSEALRRGLLTWYVDGSGLFHPHPAKARIFLNEAVEKSVYRYPENILKEFNSTPYVFPKDNINKSLKNHVDTVVENDEYIYVDGWAYLRAKNIEKQTTLVLLRSPEHTIACPTVPIKRPDVAEHFQSRSLKHSGFGALISKKMIQLGKYEVGVYVESYDDRALSFSGKYVEIKK